jgi:hypothetical protein
VFDAVHQTARPNEFGREQPQAKENYEHARARSDQHHHAYQQQGESSDDEEDSADLFNRTEDRT